MFTHVGCYMAAVALATLVIDQVLHVLALVIAAQVLPVGSLGRPVA